MKDFTRDFFEDNDAVSALYDYCLALRLTLQTARCADYDRLDLAGACRDAALLVCRYVQARGGFAELIEGTIVIKDLHGKTRGDYHCWSRIRYGGRSSLVVDITATQFSDAIPPVLIVPEREAKRRYLYQPSSTLAPSYTNLSGLTVHQARNAQRRALRLVGDL